MCVSLLSYATSVQVLREATRGRLVPLELEWEAVRNCLMWMLGTDLRSSGRTASVCFSCLEAKVLICIPLTAQLGLVQRMCLKINVFACCDFNNVSKSEKQNGRSLKLPWPLLRWGTLLNSLMRTSQTYCSCACHAGVVHCSCACVQRLWMPCRCCVLQLCMLCRCVYCICACRVDVVHCGCACVQRLWMLCRCCVLHLCMPCRCVTTVVLAMQTLCVLRFAFFSACRSCRSSDCISPRAHTNGTSGFFPP